MAKQDIFEPGSRRMTPSGLRLNNERAVLTAVALNPEESAAQIARRTGLGPQSVSRILVKLEQAGLVRRGEARSGQRGQPPVPISLNPDGVFCLGCEIGWRHLTLVIRNLGGEILGEHRVDYRFPDAASIARDIAALAVQLTDHVPARFRHRILGIGLAVPVNIARHIELIGASAADAQAWRELDLVKAIEVETGLRVFSHNDGNAACWGELAAHPAPRPNNMAYFLVGTFVAAGLIAEGRLWEGPTGNSANLGSMIVTDRSGRQNFVHLVASLTALEGRLVAAGKPVPAGNPDGWNWESLEPQASDWIDEAGRALAKTIANTAAVMEFDVAVVDGDMPRAMVGRLVASVRQHTDELPIFTSARPRVEQGRLGSGAPARGAAAKPIYRRLFSRDTADLGEFLHSA